MRFINKKMVVVVIIIGIFCTIFIWKNTSDKETKLESVSLNESKTLNNEMFAIMLEQADGTYKESTEKLWPTDMQYNSSMSGCIDINGNKIENALTFDKVNNIATVDTTSTSYCYLYFSYPKLCETGTKIGECILENSETINKDMEGGLYRYQGTKEEITDNYICFGTNSKTECLNNTDKYLYRIIGVDNSGNVKLIKATSIGKNKWHNNYTENTTWPQSDLHKALNGDTGTEENPITPIFIDSSTYTYLTTDGDWYNKIAWTEWNYGDTTSNGNYDRDTIYAVESAWGAGTSANSGKQVAKIGLMYIHDYYYAYGVGGSPGTYTEAKTAWIFLESHEWTMSRYGLYGRYCAWFVNSNGQINSNHLTYSSAVRPVFYLTSNVEVIGGTGNSTDPLIIN